MKKFKTTSTNQSEFVFAPSKEQAEKLFKQINPFKPLVAIREVSINY